MKTQHCQTCSHWDQASGLEMTNLGAIAPCTRHAPAHFNFERVELTGAALNFSAYPVSNAISDMQIPMAIWPYTGRNQICGDYQPCDLEESARRTRLRSAPISWLQNSRSVLQHGEAHCENGELTIRIAKRLDAPAAEAVTVPIA